MSANESWVQALKISSETLSEWQNQAPADRPLVVWAIEQGHIDKDLYLHWASRHYEIAIVSPECFTGESLAGLAQYKQSQEWAPWIFPIGEWDGTLFVACAEPPGVDYEQTEFRYFLADPGVMVQAWESVTDITGINDLPPIPSQDALQGLDLAQSVTDTGFKLQLDVSSVSPQTKMTSTEVSPFAHPSIENSLDQESTRTLLQLDSQYRNSEPPSEVQFTQAPDESSLSLTSPGLSTLAPRAPVAAPPQTPPPPMTLDLSSLKIIGQPQIISASSETVQPNCPAPVQVVQASPSPSPSSQHFEAVIKEVATIYPHVIVFRYNSTVAEPLEWNTNTQILNAQSAKMSLDAPSLFRIVFKTKMPYHGFVVGSQEHLRFFGEINKGTLPKCVTALPLKMNGQEFGVLVAFGDKDLHTVETLTKIENIVGQLLPKIKIAA